MSGRLPFGRAWRRGRAWLDAGSVGFSRSSHGSSRRFHQIASGGSSRGGAGPRAASGASSSSNPLRRALRSYDALNASHPTATKIGTSVAILLFGDASAQRIQHDAAASAAVARGDPPPAFALDRRRLLAFASFGALYTGWFQMHWFRLLQRAFPRPADAARRSLARRPDVLGPLLVNQLVAVPCLYYPFYFSWTGLIRGFAFDESVEMARAKYRPSLLAQNWAFWFPAQGVQFALVPSAYHIVYVSAMGLAWNTILSLVTLENKNPDRITKPAPKAEGAAPGEGGRRGAKKRPTERAR
jgi:protein Mpv17